MRYAREIALRRASRAKLGVKMGRNRSIGGASLVSRDGSQVLLAQSGPASHLLQHRQPQHERTRSERSCASPLYSAWEADATKLVTAQEKSHANL
jgi:hypothetical protein